MVSVVRRAAASMAVMRVHGGSPIGKADFVEFGQLEMAGELGPQRARRARRASTVARALDDAALAEGDADRRAVDAAPGRRARSAIRRRARHGRAELFVALLDLDAAGHVETASAQARSCALAPWRPASARRRRGWSGRSAVSSIARPVALSVSESSPSRHSVSRERRPSRALPCSCRSRARPRITPRMKPSVGPGRAPATTPPVGIVDHHGAVGAVDEAQVARLDSAATCACARIAAGEAVGRCRQARPHAAAASDEQRPATPAPISVPRGQHSRGCDMRSCRRAVAQRPASAPALRPSATGDAAPADWRRGRRVARAAPRHRGIRHARAASAAACRSARAGRAATAAR